MLTLVVSVLLIVAIVLIWTILSRPKIVVLEEEIPAHLKKEDDIDVEDAAKLLYHKLSNYVYIEDNKIKLEILSKK